MGVFHVFLIVQMVPTRTTYHVGKKSLDHLWATIIFLKKTGLIILFYLWWLTFDKNFKKPNKSILRYMGPLQNASELINW